MAILHNVSHNLFMSGRPRERHVDELKLAGITAVVCLATRDVPAIIESVRVWYHMPLPDGKSVDAEQVNRVVKVVNELRNSGFVVLVHCNAGCNRAGLVATLAVRNEFDSTAAALEHVRSVRPRAVANPAFQEYLRRFT